MKAITQTIEISHNFKNPALNFKSTSSSSHQLKMLFDHQYSYDKFSKQSYKTAISQHLLALSFVKI
jgi:hypothetical protein